MPGIRVGMKILLAGVMIHSIITTAAVADDPAPNETVGTNTTDPIFGTGASFFLQGPTNGWIPEETKWEYQFRGGCTGPWTDFGPTDLTVLLKHAGTLSVKCTRKYNNGSGGKTFGPITLPNYVMSVPPPDGFRIVGDGKPIRFGVENPVQMQVTCKGQDSIYFGASYAQERIEKVVYWNGPRNHPKDWAPTRADIMADTFLSRRFAYKGMGRILDLKRQDTGGHLARGTTIRTFTQHVRIILKDPCGTDMAPTPLGSKNVTIKVSPTNQSESITTH